MAWKVPLIIALTRAETPGVCGGGVDAAEVLPVPVVDVPEVAVAAVLAAACELAAAGGATVVGMGAPTVLLKVRNRLANGLTEVVGSGRMGWVELDAGETARRTPTLPPRTWLRPAAS